MKHPPAILGIGRNYAAHANELGNATPDAPLVFFKNPASVIANGEPIVIPEVCDVPEYGVDYEGELGVLIGTTCRDVPKASALEVVSHYCVANDVSHRWWQWEGSGGQFCRGKSFDTFCPSGPCLATADEIPDPSKLTIRTFVNEDKMQESSTDDLIFDVPHLISFLSGSTTLLPGTLILTGTPSGVGDARDPRRYLVPGDEVTVEIDGVGILTNPVVEEIFGPDAEEPEGTE